MMSNRVATLLLTVVVSVLVGTNAPVAQAALSTASVQSLDDSDRQEAADQAVAVLMDYYNEETGLFDTTGWWQSANALTAVLDYMARSGSREYLDEVENTFEKNKGDNFTNRYMDDTGWWGLAWIRAYDLTGEQRYLDMAQKTADYMYSYQDNPTWWTGPGPHCGGGIWWRKGTDYKNAVANELYIKLAASLHNRINGDTVNLERAQEIWTWFKASGMINDEKLVNDGLNNRTCRNNRGTTWTYNQGIILGALVELHAATGDPRLLAHARQMADASISSEYLNPDGILTEPCKDGCGYDRPSFKGIYMRNLGELARALPGRPYNEYIQRQADSILANAGNGTGQYGLHWAGPFDIAHAGRQQSAVDALTAALPPIHGSQP